MVGKDRHPSLDDKPEMHYTNAVLLESFRITSFLPVAVPHSALADVKVKNYVIPKGAIVLPSLFHVMYDVSKPFCDACHGHGYIQLAVEGSSFLVSRLFPKSFRLQDVF